MYLGAEILDALDKFIVVGLQGGSLLRHGVPGRWVSRVFLFNILHVVCGLGLNMVECMSLGNTVTFSIVNKY